MMARADPPENMQICGACVYIKKKTYHYEISKLNTFLQMCAMQDFNVKQNWLSCG